MLKLSLFFLVCFVFCFDINLSTLTIASSRRQNRGNSTYSCRHWIADCVIFWVEAKERWHFCWMTHQNKRQKRTISDISSTAIIVIVICHSKDRRTHCRRSVGPLCDGLFPAACYHRMTLFTCMHVSFNRKDVICLWLLSFVCLPHNYIFSWQIVNIISFTSDETCSSRFPFFFRLVCALSKRCKQHRLSELSLLMKRQWQIALTTTDK